MICKKEKYDLQKAEQKRHQTGRSKRSKLGANLSCHTVSKSKENRKKLLGESKLSCTVRILYWLD